MFKDFYNKPYESLSGTFIIEQTVGFSIIGEFSAATTAPITVRLEFNLSAPDGRGPITCGKTLCEYVAENYTARMNKLLDMAINNVLNLNSNTVYVSHISSINIGRK